MGLNFAKTSVLIVDDTASMRVLLRSVLNAAGFIHTREASDGAAALEELKHSPTDLMITDLFMPILDGVELVRAIRTAPDSINPLLPVIMLTGHSERSKVIAARDAGVSDFLVKPVTTAGLIRKIETVLLTPRPFVRSATYFGPDRRRRADKDYPGPWRRADDADRLLLD
jgi:two-component system, chemotaxis family, chemotaxis protein CheY